MSDVKRKKTRKTISTPLLELLRACSDEQRTRIAQEAGTSVGYLYGVAGCHRQRINVALALGIEDASAALHKETGGKLPIVTARMLASMCAIDLFAQD